MPRNMNTDLQELRQAKGPTPLASVMFPDAMKVLVLAPHPDDFDEIAVTLRFFHDRGHAIKLAVSRTGSGVPVDAPGRGGSFSGGRVVLMLRA